MDVGRAMYQNNAGMGVWEGHQETQQMYSPGQQYSQLQYSVADPAWAEGVTLYGGGEPVTMYSRPGSGEQQSGGAGQRSQQSMDSPDRVRQLYAGPSLAGTLPQPAQTPAFHRDTAGPRNNMEKDQTGQSFKIGLTFDPFGKREVILSGNKEKFISFIHQTILSFLREHKIPVKSFCQSVLRRTEVLTIL